MWDLGFGRRKGEMFLIGEGFDRCLVGRNGSEFGDPAIG